MKYYGGFRICLPAFDRVSIRTLSGELGLVLLVDGKTDPTHRIRRRYFFISRAWEICGNG